MKRLSISNAFFVCAFSLLSPVYPVFWSVLYNISWGIQNFSVDTTSILDDTFDKEDAQFISADVPIDTVHDWENRKESITYTVQEGDTLWQLAYDFGISRDTIRWVNALTSNALRVGQKLMIPPGNGYIYISQEWDTLTSIALKYTTSKTEILKNNPYLSDVVPVGSLVYMPHMKPPIVTPDSIVASDQALREESLLSYKLRLIHPSGKWFVPGHCTYFVAKYWDVQWRWHAKDWYKNAQKAGYKTGKIAQPGAIAVWYGPGYNLSYGHVGIVMSVNEKQGTMVVKDMNYTGLWRITTRTEKLKNKYLIGFIYNQKI